ncbi:hypothetical protein QWZ13_01055 [Reinekea marina]|uniref:hypothetical protein n=1 Tax=Reinekea marina TaxID=1310421 RepID=UPI0025B56D7A|nr:hypothetical protein [Reinekea marina]MDN3647490.1 hypothetical protein [Reinekea marina]
MTLLLVLLKRKKGIEWRIVKAPFNTLMGCKFKLETYQTLELPRHFRLRLK